MSNETKRDVFEELLDAYDDAKSSNGNLHPTQELLDYDDRYDNALPDNLPVIPKAVGEILRSAYGEDNLLGVLETSRNGKKVSETLAWIIANQNTFASAWVLGVWRVEETGETAEVN